MGPSTLGHRTGQRAFVLRQLVTGSLGPPRFTAHVRCGPTAMGAHVALGRWQDTLKRQKLSATSLDRSLQVGHRAGASGASSGLRCAYACRGHREDKTHVSAASASRAGPEQDVLFPWLPLRRLPCPPPELLPVSAGQDPDSPQTISNRGRRGASPENVAFPVLKSTYLPAPAAAADTTSYLVLTLGGSKAGASPGHRGHRAPPGPIATVSGVESLSYLCT